MGIAKQYAENQENRKFSAKAYAKKIDKYNSTDYSMVNQAYIDSFMKDAGSYFNTATKDYESMGWGNASNLYNTRNTSYTDLSSRADAIGAYLYHNKNNLNKEAYDYYNDYLDSFYESGRGIVDSFKNYSDYFKQWTTQKDYDLWKADEDEYARVRALPGFSKYTDSKFQKNYEAQIGMDILGTKGAFVGSNAIGDRNINIERIKKYLTPEDLAIYYYYLEKEPEKAEAYYNKISDQATYESAKSKSKLYNQTGVEWLNSVVAGVDSFSAGMQNVGNAVWGTENETIQPSVSQYAFDMMRQDNDGLWAIANDLAQTIGNQLPSMALNAAIPGAGLVTMGVSAAGNAYAEMKQIEGISETQAIAYGATIGVLEATLQKIMGGISGLGSDGGFVQKAVNKALPNITNGFARAIVSLGANMADEGIEEAAQTALEPIVQWITSGNIPSQFNSGEDFINHIGDIAYSGFLGALSAGALEGGTDTINTLQLNSQYSKAYSKNPEALKTLLESIAMENPTLDISKAQSKVDAGKKVSGNLIRELAYQNEIANWNKDYNKVVSATESRLNELGEQGNVKKLAESIARAQFGDFGSAIENAENVVRSTKDANADTLAYAMADYRGDIKDLSRSDKRNIRHSEYGSRVSNELNPDMRGETSSAWAEDIKTNRLGKGAEGVAKTQATLKALREATTTPTVVPNAFNYKSGVITPNLTKEGVEAKEKDLEGIANNRGYKGTTHEAFVKGYKGENLEEYQLGFDEAYRMGRTMVRSEELQNAVFKSYINEEAQMSAYNSGYTEAKYESSKKAEGRVKTEKVKGGFTVTVPLSNEALTESRKTAIEFFKVVAEVANANIKVVEDAKNHGLYDPKTNTISIDVNLGGKDFMVFSLSHELTHRIREMLPEQFDDFAKMLFEAVGGKMSVTERIKLWEKNNKQYYPKLTSEQLTDLAYEEVVCEMCESFLTDEVVARKLSEKVQKENKTLWEKIKDFFTDLINRLKEAYKNLDPQSENGRLVREMTDDLTKVKEAWAELVVESGKVEKVASESEVKKSAKDFEDYNKPITLADIELLRSIGEKNVNDLTAEEIKKAQKWAYKFYQELKTKSPFFRAWFGEWRAFDTTKIKTVVVPTIDISQVHLANGDYSIADTGWTVHAGKTLNDDTRHYTGGKRINVKSLTAIESILNNAVLLESIIGEPNTNKKSPNIAFLHKLYTPIEYDGRAYLAKITVEEYYNETYKNVSRKAYNLRAIKIEPAGGQLGNKSSSSVPVTDSIDSIADLYELVKTFDKEFTPAPEVDKVLLNEDGTPKLLYHQTAEDFSEFDPRHKGAGTNDDETPFGIFMKPNDEDIGLQGKKQMALYARIGNPLIVANRAEMVRKLKSMSSKYGELAEQRNALSSEYKTKIEEAAQKWSQYAKDYRAEHPNATRTALYDDAEFHKLYNAEDELTEEWIAKADELSLKMKEEITATLESNNYDGVVIRKDEGSGGRTVETFIALDPEQVKSATDNIGTFSKYETDTKYSRKIPDPYTSRELLAKALTKVAKGEERVLLEQYKSNLRMIEGEMGNLKNLRKEIDAIKYKKSITYKGENLSVKEFEQRAYTQAEAMGVNAENIKFKAHKDTGKYAAMVDGKVILEADKAFRSKEEADHINTLEHNYQATLVRISKYDASLLRIEAMQPMKQLLSREKAKAYKEAEAKGKEALKEYKAQAIEQQKAITQRYQEMRHKNVEQRATTEMRHKLMNTVHTLDQLLVNPTKKKHIPIGLQKPVAEALNILNMDTVGAEERLAKITAELKVTDDQYEMEMLLERYNRIKAQGDKIKEKIDSLKAAYDKLLTSDDEIIRNSHDEVISNMIQIASEKIGDKAVRDMTYDELEMLYKMYRAILKTVRDANTSFKMAKGEEISELGQSVMGELAGFERKNKEQIKLIANIKDGAEWYQWNNLKPIYAFKRIGSSTLETLYNNVREGEDVWAVDMSDARAFSDAEKTKFGYSKWDMDKSYTFRTRSGKDFKLTLGQIMSIYAYTKRGEQAINHLVEGGFVYDGTTEIKKNVKGNIEIAYELKDSTAYRLSEEIIGQINATLTPAQKSFVDSMQNYLSTVMGEKGNEVSLALYDIKLFGEKNYFPLKSSQVFLERAREQARGEVKVKNKGFTKETTPKANNPIVLESFMDVWANHCVEMGMYHAFTLPLEDFYRVHNYKERATDEKDSESVIMHLENAFGNSATKYIDQLLVDINGGTRADPRINFSSRWIAKFKKAKTFLSASVVIQQPSAVTRAMALIEGKYFLEKPTNHKATWNEIKKYAPVAIIKEMGYFDTGMGLSSKDWLKNEPTKMEKAEEALSKAPAYADEIGWNIIWRAVKREIADTTNLKVNSEEFLERCGERFTEVITMTQVYDSVFARSSLMRSKDGLAKMLTAFMAEPTTTINMLAYGLNQRVRGNKGVMRRFVGACLTSAILNSMLVSIVYAARDDDEDEEYWEKYFGALGKQTIDSVNIFKMMPFIKDMVSIFEGFTVSRTDVSLITDIYWAWQKLDNDNVSAYKKVEDFAGSIAAIFGVPLKNLMRDLRALWNLITSSMK